MQPKLASQISGKRSNGSENVAEDSFAIKQDIFQQGTALNEHSSSSDMQDHPVSMVQSEAKPPRSNGRACAKSRSVSPFSQLNSDMAVSNGLSNQGKGTTFLFDDDDV